MTTFLPEDIRDRLIDALTELGMPQEMAEEFAGWPDEAEILDVHLTAMVNQAAGYRDQITAGNKSVTKYLLADVFCLMSYMSQAEQRGWNELQLPMMNEACDTHNYRWKQPTTLQ